MFLSLTCKRIASCFAVLISICTTATANVIFTNSQIDEHGTGFGHRATILALHANGTEFGSVLWDSAQDVLTDDAINQSQTRTVAELLAGNINHNNLVVVFNINDGGNSSPALILHDFHLVFQSTAGVELFRESYTAPAIGLPLDQAGNGNGASGWRFDLDFAGHEAAVAAFFSVPTNRIGMIIDRDNTIDDTKGGADSFYVTAIVPEPTSASSLLAGIACLTCLVRRQGSRKSRTAQYN